MAGRKKQPELRFKGFSGDWEECELGAESIEIIAGGDVDKSRIVNSGKYPVLANALTNDGIIGYYNDSFRIKAPAVTVTGRGDVGHAKARKFDFTPVVRLLSVISMHDVDFLDNAINNHKVMVESTGVPQLTVPQLSKYRIYFPQNDNEEIVMGEFFSNIDNLITLQQRKLDKLINIKKSLLEKMFPKNGAVVPEIRFKGFNDDWEQREMREILTETRRPIKMEDGKEYQLVTVKRRNEGIISRGYLKGKDILVKSYFELKAGDYLISKRQVVHGATGIVPENLDGAIVSNEYLVSIENENITTEFLTILSKLPQMYKMFFLSSYGVDIEKLVFNVEDWKKRKVLIPSIAEQKKIGEFFNHLDNLITLHQRKLEKLKNIKKACLEKMFV